MHISTYQDVQLKYVQRALVLGWCYIPRNSSCIENIPNKNVLNASNLPVSEERCLLVCATSSGEDNNNSQCEVWLLLNACHISHHHNVEPF